jgi:hypothetical protein
MLSSVMGRRSTDSRLSPHRKKGEETKIIYHEHTTIYGHHRHSTSITNRHHKSGEKDKGVTRERRRESVSE